MINPINLITQAKKWRNLAASGRKRRVLAMGSPTVHETNKGHFVFYTTDKKRFVVPLTYLNSNIFRELFRVAEEEFGLPTDGPITLPCDASFMDKVVSVLAAPQRDLENTLLGSMAVGHLCSTATSSGPTQILLRGF